MFNKALKTSILVISVFALQATLAFSQESGGLKGKVRTASGNGIPNATVSARQNGADVKSVTADNKGQFVLEGLAPGKYNVLFDAKGYASGVLYNVEVRKRNLRDLGDRLILTVDRGTLVIVQGSVFYKEGTSVTAAKVECEEVMADGSTRKIGTTETSSDGEFTFKMREGVLKLRLTATMKGVTGSKEITIDEGAAVYRLSILLDLSRTVK